MLVNELVYDWAEFERALNAPGYSEIKALNTLAVGILNYAAANKKYFNLEKNFPLFRARAGGVKVGAEVSPQKPFVGDAISAPPAAKAASGRFNPEGVPFLYLSTSEEVAIAETRPMPNERSSVAKFEISSGMNLVNLIPVFDPLLMHGNRLGPHGFWYHLCENAAQQFSSADVKRKYRSLQFVASVFQEGGYDGIIYRSAFFEDHWSNDSEPWGGGGFYNYVLFDKGKARFLSSELKILKRSLSCSLV